MQTPLGDTGTVKGLCSTRLLSTICDLGPTHSIVICHLSVKVLDRIDLNERRAYAVGAAIPHRNMG